MSPIRLRRALPEESTALVPLGDRAGWWSVVVPETTTNLIVNPSLEAAATGYQTSRVGATLARASGGVFGAYALSYTDGAANVRDTYRNVAGELPTASWACFSLYVKRADGRAITRGSGYRLSVDSTLGTLDPTWIEYAGSGWYRLSVARYFAGAPGNNVVGLVYPDGVTHYTDAWQLEAKAYPTTFCDGSQVGCTWLGTPNASQSTREASSRAGGRLVNFKDFCFTVTAIVGAGAAAFGLVSTPYALMGGGSYQRSVPQIRTFNLAGRFECSTMIDLHRNQQGLLDAVKPDATNQLVRLRYQPTDCDTPIGIPLEIDAVYTGGLEGNLTQGEGTESAALGFTVYVPMQLGRSALDTGAALGYVQTVADANYILQRSAGGVWQALGTGAAGAAVNHLAVGLDGAIYAAGSFASIGGVANTAYIAKWNGTAWSALGTGANDTVYDLAVGPDGSLYAVGKFTLMGGVANTARVAKWNGTAWSALDVGADNQVLSVAVGQDGAVYIGGLFTAPAAQIAKWNGAAWSALGSGSDGNAVHKMRVGLNGDLYAGGHFSVMGGVAGTAHIARWNGSAWSQLAGGSNGNYVYALAVGPDGAIYAGGDFTTIGGIAASRIARWNGSQWEPLGSGVDNTVFTLAFDEASNLHVGGLFLTAGGMALTDRLAVWNGSVWLMPDVDMPGAGGTYDIVIRRGVLTLGFNGSGNAASAAVTVVTNTGGMDAWPRVVFSGPGRVIGLRNFTTGDALYFNLTLNAGENAVLTLGPNPSFVSDFRGNLLPTILPGSNLATWRLQPGANNVSLYMTGTTAATAATLVFRAPYDSIYSSVK